MDYTEELKKKAVGEGISHFGVADLKLEAFSSLKEQPAFAPYTYAISLASIFPAASVAELKEGPSHTYIYHYRIVNALLDEVALKISNQLNLWGYQSYPIPVSQRVEKGKLTGIFPHRLTAWAAGLGYRGKNNLIILPEFGSCIRLVTILTNASLKASESVKENRCGKCHLCIDNCPAKAISQNKEGKSEFDAVECDQYLQWVRDRFGKRVCGKCIAFCLHTPNNY